MMSVVEMFTPNQSNHERLITYRLRQLLLKVNSGLSVSICEVIDHIMNEQYLAHN